MNRLGANSRLSKRGRRRQATGRRTVATVARDVPLMLFKEYPTQPVCEHEVQSASFLLVTTITTGIIASNVPIQASSMANNFASRFLAYAEHRVVGCRAEVILFSSTQTGVLNQWFDEDDSAAPTSGKAANAICRRFNASDVTRTHKMNYVPHDPAQQTWSLTSAASPIIGYHKLYTDASNYGSPIAVTTIGTVQYFLKVQFRGFL